MKLKSLYNRRPISYNGKNATYKGHIMYSLNYPGLFQIIINPFKIGTVCYSIHKICMLFEFYTLIIHNADTVIITSIKGLVEIKHDCHRLLIRR